MANKTFIWSVTTGLGLRKLAMTMERCQKHLALRQHFRNLAVLPTQEKDGKAPVKSVFISQSEDIFTNLALEDWLYRNFNFENHNVLLLWRNTPCVVIGRHQNPWVEANVSQLLNQNIIVARRNSGGGTVFHDRGNLNCTFFTARERYNRGHNLQIVCNALHREWGLPVEISKREDIVLEGDFKQISGTAAKLGRTTSYHHCTLLVNVELKELRKALNKENHGIESRATQSVKAAVKNLKELLPNITVESALTAVGWEFLRTKPSGIDGGYEEINKQNGFSMLNPTDNWFPGLASIKDDFRSWDWTYGKTPQFTVTRTFPIPESLLGETGACEVNNELTIKIEVSRGCIDDVTLKIPTNFIKGFHGDLDVVTPLKGKKFSQEAVHHFEHIFVKNEPKESREKNEFVADCVRRVVQAV